MKFLLLLSRIIVGVLFIFSGLIKANDPLGLSYKMQEFFEVWGWHSLNDYTLAMSVLMIAFEIIAGVAVLAGWRFSLFSWLLLLLIIFFTFLTGYALLSGRIRECGCFGDCIKLTAKESFIKDLVLLGLILILFFYRNKVRPVFSNMTSVILLGITVIFSFGIQFYVIRHLPVIDCLPYKVGNNIPEKMKIPPGSIPDSTVINYVYLKDNKEIEFDADHFPDDFDDSLYKFVKRYDKVVRKGNAQPPIKDFVIISPSGTDTTRQLLEQEGYTLMLFTKDLPKDAGEWTWANDFKEVIDAGRRKNISVLVVSSDAEYVAAGLHTLKMGDVPVMKGDLVAIKTAARANPSLYLLNKGTIAGKWSYADLKKALDDIARVNN